MIDGHGAIVEEFFDIGASRSIPWKRRPEAARLLAAMRDPGRSFDAVVIGEPQRAFYGNQYGLTYPVLQHYRVGLWVPEVGGVIDPESEAHDLVMSVFAGMSKGERNRIRIRVRTEMAAQAQSEGRFLGGRLRGLVCCSVCGRKMQGTWNHGRAHYRCRFPYEYALANRIEHPAAVYLREDAVVEHLDAWLAMAFDPGRLALVLAEIDDKPAVDTAAEAARRELAECDRLLARHRVALEAGADPQMVAEWPRDVRRRRESAEAGLRERSDARPRRLGPAEVGAVVESLGGLMKVLRRADTDDKCELCRELGVSMIYQHPEPMPRSVSGSCC